MIKKIILALLVVLTYSQGDTIYFNNGAVLEGIIEEQNAQTITISVNNKETTYAMRDVRKVEHTAVTAPPPPPAMIAVQRVPESVVIPSGTVIHISTISALNTHVHKTGHKFRAILESAIMAEGVLVAPKGSDVYGVITESKQARRLAGKSSMMLELTAISVDHQQVPIRTQTLNALTQGSQAGNTAAKVARGAALGALAGGSSGARTGAKFGAGAAILSPGKGVGIYENTMLDFMLVSDVRISLN